MNNIMRLVNNIPQEVDGVLITSAVNRKYFTGFRASAGTLLITKEKSYFIIDFRYFELASKLITDAEVILQTKLKDQLIELKDKHNIKTLTIESSNLTVSDYLRFKEIFGDTEICFSNQMSDIIASLREIKTHEEINCISTAQSYAEKAFTEILNFIKVGCTETEIAARLEYEMRIAGSEGTSFDTITVSGKNSSLPHGKPSEKKVEAGDFITMDYGAKYNSYCSDMTRTVAVGHISEEMNKVYHTVLKAQIAAIDVIKAGVKCSMVDNTARDIINSAGYEGRFGHGLGHSLGLEVHENPRFSNLSKDMDICKVGHIMTVEPGIYLPGAFGVRIEDMVVITKIGCINLTKAEKKLIIL